MMRCAARSIDEELHRFANDKKRGATVARHPYEELGSRDRQAVEDEREALEAFHA